MDTQTEGVATYQPAGNAVYTHTVTQRQSLAVLLAQTAVAVVVLTASTILAAMGQIDGSAVTAIYGAAIGLVGGATVSLGGSVINGGPRPDYAQLASSSPEAALALSHHPPHAVTDNHATEHAAG